MREWRRGVYTPPTLCSGRAYFMLAKEKAELPGNVWARIEEPYVLERGGATTRWTFRFGTATSWRPPSR